MIDIILTDATIQISSDDSKELKKIEKFQTYDDNSACFSRGGYDIKKLKHVPLMKNIKGRLVGFAGLAKEIRITAPWVTGWWTSASCRMASRAWPAR